MHLAREQQGTEYVALDCHLTDILAKTMASLFWEGPRHPVQKLKLLLERVVHLNVWSQVSLADPIFFRNEGISNIL